MLSNPLCLPLARWLLPFGATACGAITRMRARHLDLFAPPERTGKGPVGKKKGDALSASALRKPTPGSEPPMEGKKKGRRFDGAHEDATTKMCLTKNTRKKGRRNDAAGCVSLFFSSKERGYPKKDKKIVGGGCAVGRRQRKQDNGICRRPCGGGMLTFPLAGPRRFRRWCLASFSPARRPRFFLFCLCGRGLHSVFPFILFLWLPKQRSRAALGLFGVAAKPRHGTAQRHVDRPAHVLGNARPRRLDEEQHRIDAKVGGDSTRGMAQQGLGARKRTLAAHGASGSPTRAYRIGDIDAIITGDPPTCRAHHITADGIVKHIGASTAQTSRHLLAASAAVVEAVSWSSCLVPVPRGLGVAPFPKRVLLTRAFSQVFVSFSQKKKKKDKGATRVDKLSRWAMFFLFANPE